MEIGIQKILTVGLSVVYAAAIFIIGKWLARFLSDMTEVALGRTKTDVALTKFLKNLIYFALLSFVVIAALGQLGIQTASFVAVLGAAGFAVGMALQGSLSNFAAGVMILIFKPFYIGDYVTAAGTATAGTDFVAAAGRLNWAAGDAAAKTVTVSILDDSLVEGDETFTVTLLNPVGTLIGSPGGATVTIVDNDTPTACFVVRQLPAGYAPGAKFTVHLVATPPTNTASYAVEDVPPTGWVVGVIDQGGSFDSLNGKVKFGSFADAVARTFSYEITPPTNALGTQTFAGAGFFNTNRIAICGQSTVDFIFRHPADISAPFGRITGEELTGYESAWKLGLAWSVAPTSIPISYVSRAGAIWRGGERYYFDSTVTTPPLWWVTNTTGTIVVQSVNALHAVPAGMVAESVGAPSMAWADLPGGFQRGRPMVVVIHVRPGTPSLSVAVEDAFPAGWQIVTNSISDAGQYDGVAGKVRWGTFTGPHDLTYTINPGTNEAPGLFTGVASFDGTDVPIMGRRISIRAPWVPDAGSVNTNRNILRDGFRMQVQGEVSKTYLLQGSYTPWDAGSWVNIATNAPGAGDQGHHGVRRAY